MFTVAHKWAQNVNVKGSSRFYKHFVPMARPVCEPYCFPCRSFNRITTLSLVSKIVQRQPKSPSQVRKTFGKTL